MKLEKAWLWVALLGLVALFVVNVLVEEPIQRGILSVVTVLPLLYLTYQVTVVAGREAAHERRKYMKLRVVADEFMGQIRNLNRLAIISKSENPPEQTEEMIEDVVNRMRAMVDRIRDAAGEEDPEVAGG
jgi:hypothetical protein